MTTTVLNFLQMEQFHRISFNFVLNIAAISQNYRRSSVFLQAFNSSRSSSYPPRFLSFYSNQKSKHYFFLSIRDFSCDIVEVNSSLEFPSHTIHIMLTFGVDLTCFFTYKRFVLLKRLGMR